MTLPLMIFKNCLKITQQERKQWKSVAFDTFKRLDREPSKFGGWKRRLAWRCAARDQRASERARRFVLLGGCWSRRDLPDGGRALSLCWLLTPDTQFARSARVTRRQLTRSEAKEKCRREQRQVCVCEKTAVPSQPASVRALKYLFNERLKVFKCSSFILLEIIYLGARGRCCCRRDKGATASKVLSLARSLLFHIIIFMWERWSERGTPFAAAERWEPADTRPTSETTEHSTRPRVHREAQSAICSHFQLKLARLQVLNIILNPANFCASY